MDGCNGTEVTEFILLGLSDNPDYQCVLFLSFLLVYIFTLTGNTLIIAATCVASQLHTPMYFFLSSLSFVDMGLTSVTVPKMLANILSSRKSISVSGCIAQLSFFISFASAECFLLTVMAYDRYVAICNPLRYAAVMSRGVCLLLVAVSWLAATLHSVLHSLLTARLSFCGSNRIHHFFCDMTPLLKLASSDTSTNELVIFVEGPFSVVVPFLIILVSYFCIISAILQIRSEKGRGKIFSTCSSHLTVVALFYGTAIFTYFRPTATYSLDHDRVVTLMYTVVAPMMNPLIYSLRNNDMREAFLKVFFVRHW
ncbi:olfactory receptor 5AP2-like [Ambystoma mexicanum]|uniref:olfactory receptor 5AP2-like n=1 Tax=Ambystoma mexicanum TaxID=8296 RepID=UPI0037E83957